MPGETSYVVLEADEAPAQDGVVEAQAPDAARSPWFTDLWSSVEAAGGDPKTAQVTDRPDPRDLAAVDGAAGPGRPGRTPGGAPLPVREPGRRRDRAAAARTARRSRPSTT